MALCPPSFRPLLMHTFSQLLRPLPPPPLSAAAPPPPSLREKDDSIREAMAEALLAFASTRLGRAALWKIKAPDILKKGCEWRYSVHAAFVRPLA